MSEGHPDNAAPEHHLPQDHSHPHAHGEEHDDGPEDMNGKKRRRPDQRQHPTDYTDRRTLFIINLPRDVTSRELYNMLYFMDGFCKVQLYEPAPKSTEASINTLSAFALFDSQAQAMAASTRLHGHTFDPVQYGTPITSTSGSTFVTPIATGSHILQVRLANKNLIMTKEERESVHKRARTDSTPSVSASAFGYGAAAGSMGMGHMPAYAASNGGSNASPYYLPPTSVAPYGYAYPGANFAYGASQAQAASVPSASGAVPPGTLHLTPGPLPVSQHPPGTTLFLARMGTLTPPEILNLCVSACPHGFRDHKITTDRSGQRVAFVQYDTIENATAALSRIHGYQGTVGAFSKNPLGVKGPSQGLGGQQAQAYQQYPSHY